MTQPSIRRAAVKTGSTGVTVLPPTHDTPAYSAHLAEYEKKYRSQGARGFEFSSDNLARHGFEFSTAPAAIGFEFSNFDPDTHLDVGFSPTPSTRYRK